jgi:hypothetical protein
MGFYAGEGSDCDMKAGQRFIITTGEYSDFGIRDSFVVLKTFSFDRALARWLKMNGRDGEFYFDASEQDFLEYLRAQGYVADDGLNQVHLSDYSRPGPNPANDESDEP